MQPDQYLGWLALGLTPGLGPRMAGKLLQEFGTPEAIFNASLSSLESKRLPAVISLTGTNPTTRSACAKFTIPHPSSMSAEMLNF
jgi:hypothetical protein